MKHFKRANIYKNSTETNTYNPVTREAWSYRWWQYVKQFDINGRKLTLFNCAGYSPTTGKHQSDTQSLMIELGHKIDREIVCPEGFQKGLDSAISHYKYSIDRNMDAIKKLKSRRSTNLKRVEWIREDNQSIDFLFKNKLVEASLEMLSHSYRVENFCANVLKNNGKFIE